MQVNSVRVAIAAFALVALGAVQATAATVFSDRIAFEATVGPSITDDYSAAGYLAGDNFDGANLDSHTDANMSAILGETRYESTGFSDNNLITGQGSGDPLYCSGCNGSFLLDFTMTSIGTAAGVFGVGFDIEGVAEGVFGTIAFVTFGDGATANYTLPERQDVFWGITDARRISSIHFGLLDGGTNTDNSVQRMALDNLTIAAPIPLPATLPLMAGGLVLLGFGLRRRGRN